MILTHFTTFCNYFANTASVEPGIPILYVCKFFTYLWEKVE